MLGFIVIALIRASAALVDGTGSYMAFGLYMSMSSIYVDTRVFFHQPHNLFSLHLAYYPSTFHPLVLYSTAPDTSPYMIVLINAG
jgi:hypothetical protein